MNDEELKNIVTDLSFWDKLSSREKELFKNNVQKVKYAKGENLHSADNECLGLLLVLTGELRVYILSEDGREVTLYRLSDGDACILSASCILHNITFDVFIDAQSDTEVLLLNISAFSQLTQGNVYVENFALKNTVDRFSDVMWAIEQILFTSFDKRLATFLLDESSKNKSPDIKLTHDQIAKYMGSAREVVSRMLKNFETLGIVNLSRGLIHIVDKDELKKMLKKL
ncbi:Crp/Fnr family transcriptional regulator [Sedimentibacter saalensis]|jgi:CRP/FNR family transcriptional regulator|uniref:CRP/FNR family transcriptional regulator n=1 Tax=Sedimentibacter saalensis TaxID=130788 RepID=A0A562JBU9_9FIRM|nr:Crp/Fnr family transcriptional regulator [Sedimentibacter saalensis]MEA5095238.1 Crp/Fnr family transcriptional regulator [Sedimentibacter saalensis]TWH80728.1 CRP/FNR family transcriptional regulator [Sedimentibacter saalensis]